MKKATQKVDKYSVSLTVGNDVFKSTGTTLLEALSKLLPNPAKHGVGIFRVDYGTKGLKMPMLVNKNKMDRLFAKPVELEIFAKRLGLML